MTYEQTIPSFVAKEIQRGCGTMYTRGYVTNADDNERVDRSHVSRIDTSSRARQNYQKLPNSSSWVLTPEAAAQQVQERFNPKPGQAPLYMTAGNEQQILSDLISHNIPTVITGPPGIGKLSLVRSVFHRLGIPLQVFVASSATPVHQLLGREGSAGAHGDLAGWQDGFLSLAARAAQGGVVNGFFLDELLHLPGELLSYLFNIIDGRQILSLPNGEEIDTKGNLRLVFSYNFDKHRRLDNVLRSRLAAICLSYPDQETEIRILMSETVGNLMRLERGREIALGLTTFANTLRSALGFDSGKKSPAIGKEETELLELLPMPPSTRLMVISAKMISSGLYGTRDAVRFFLLPPLLQDIAGKERQDLTDLLIQLINDTLPDITSPRNIMDRNMDTLLAQQEIFTPDDEDRRQTEPPPAFNWRPRH